MQAVEAGGGPTKLLETAAPSCTPTRSAASPATGTSVSGAAPGMLRSGRVPVVGHYRRIRPYKDPWAPTDGGAASRDEEWPQEQVPRR